jgi:pyruvate formate lyase activating enzyme
MLNGRSFESKLAVGSWQPAEDVMREIDKDAIFYDESGGGVTFSGGEPLMQADALAELLALCKENGYHTAVDTSGHAEPAVVKKLMTLADLWLFDLKLIDDTKHLEYTGVSNELALKILEMLARAGKEIIIRFALIPGITDEESNLRHIMNLMKKLGLTKIDVLPYHAIAREKYVRMGRVYLLEGMKEPGKEKVDEIIKFFKENGFSTQAGGDSV